MAIDIRQENFRVTRTKIKSGYCKIKGKDSYIIDKHLPVIQKVNLLGAFLASWPIEDIYVLPAVRQFLDKFSPTQAPPSGERGPKDGKHERPEQ